MQEQDSIYQIKKNGYVLLNNVLDDKQCEIYKTMLSHDAEKYSSFHVGSQNMDHGLNDKNMEKIVYNLHNKRIEYFDLCDHPKVFPIIKKMLQEGSYQNSSLMNLIGFDARNPSKNSKPQQLHLDSSLPGQGGYPLMMVVMFMLDDFTKENGCTRIVPGSHLRSDFAENNKKYDEEISVEAKQGSALIFDGSLWHGGGEKTSDASRWAVIPSYGRSFIKPAFDFSENIPSNIFNQLTGERKKLLGLNSCPPKDEFTRITRLSNEYEWKKGYELPKTP